MSRCELSPWADTASHQELRLHEATSTATRIACAVGGLYDLLPSDILRKGVRRVIYTDGSSDPGSKQSPASSAFAVLECVGNVWQLAGARSGLVQSLDAHPWFLGSWQTN